MYSVGFTIPWKILQHLMYHYDHDFAIASIMHLKTAQKTRIILFQLSNSIRPSFLSATEYISTRTIIRVGWSFVTL